MASRRFELVTTSETLTINPVGIKGLKKERVKDKAVYTVFIEGKIMIVDKDEFDFLYDIEQTGSCDNILFNIYEICNGNENLIFTGEFTTKDVEFDISNCQAVISLRKKDNNNCIIDQKDIEYNLLETDKTTFQSYDFPFSIYFIQTNVLSYRVLAGQPPISEAAIKNRMVQDDYLDEWLVVNPRSIPPGWYNYVKVDYIGEYNTGSAVARIHNYIAYTLIIRQLSSGAPSETLTTSYGDFDFVGTEDGYDLYLKYPVDADNVITGFDVEVTDDCDAVVAEEPTNPIPLIKARNPMRVTTTTSQCYYVQPIINGLSLIDYEQGIKLEDALNFLIGETCSEITEVKSDYFQINPYTTSSTNYVTGLPTKVDNIFLIQRSDVLLPDATEPATIGMISLNNLLDELSNQFRVLWNINGTVLEIEHESRFFEDGSIDIDMSGTEINSKRLKYSYQKTEMHYIQSFEFTDATHPDFVKGEIIYNDASGNKSNCVNTNSKKASNKIITTDIVMYQNQNPDATKEGFIMVAADSSDIVIIGQGKRSGHLVNNGELSVSNLMHDYHRHERVLINGWLNGEYQTFETVGKLKEGAELSHPHCCGDNFEDVFTIKSDLGIGRVEEMTYNFNQERITIKPIY